MSHCAAAGPSPSAAKPKTARQKGFGLTFGAQHKRVVSTLPTMPRDVAASHWDFYATREPGKLEQQGFEMQAAQGADQPAAAPATPAGGPGFAPTPPPRSSMNQRPPPAAGNSGAATSSSAWLASMQAGRTPRQPSPQPPPLGGVDIMAVLSRGVRSSLRLRSFRQACGNSHRLATHSLFCTIVLFGRAEAFTCSSSLSSLLTCTHVLWGARTPDIHISCNYLYRLRKLCPPRSCAVNRSVLTPTRPANEAYLAERAARSPLPAVARRPPPPRDPESEVERAKSLLDSRKKAQEEAEAKAAEATRHAEAVSKRITHVLEGTHPTLEDVTALRNIEAARQTEQQAASRFVAARFLCRTMICWDPCRMCGRARSVVVRRFEAI